MILAATESLPWWGFGFLAACLVFLMLAFFAVSPESGCFGFLFAGGILLWVCLLQFGVVG